MLNSDVTTWLQSEAITELQHQPVNLAAQPHVPASGSAPLTHRPPPAPATLTSLSPTGTSKEKYLHSRYVFLRKFVLRIHVEHAGFPDHSIPDHCNLYSFLRTHDACRHIRQTINNSLISVYYFSTSTHRHCIITKSV